MLSSVKIGRRFSSWAPPNCTPRLHPRHDCTLIAAVSEQYLLLITSETLASSPSSASRVSTRLSAELIFIGTRPPDVIATSTLFTSKATKNTDYIASEYTFRACSRNQFFVSPARSRSPLNFCRKLEMANQNITLTSLIAYTLLLVASISLAESSVPSTRGGIDFRSRLNSARYPADY